MVAVFMVLSIEMGPQPQEKTMNRKPFFMRVGAAVLFAAAMATTATPSFAFGYATGSCSVWQSFRSLTTGVYCMYL